MKEQPKFIKYVLLGIALDIAFSLIALLFITEGESIDPFHANLGLFIAIYLLGISVLTVHTILIPTFMLSLGYKGFLKLLWATPLSFMYVLAWGFFAGCLMIVPASMLNAFLPELTSLKICLNLAAAPAALMSLRFADEINLPKKYRQSFKPIAKAGVLCGMVAWLILLLHTYLPSLPVFILASALSGLCLSYLYNIHHYKIFYQDQKNIDETAGISA